MYNFLFLCTLSFCMIFYSLAVSYAPTIHTQRFNIKLVNDLLKEFLYSWLPKKYAVKLLQTLSVRFRKAYPLYKCFVLSHTHSSRNLSICLQLVCIVAVRGAERRPGAWPLRLQRVQAERRQRRLPDAAEAGLDGGPRAGTWRQWSSRPCQQVRQYIDVSVVN